MVHVILQHIASIFKDLFSQIFSGISPAAPLNLGHLTTWDSEAGTSDNYHSTIRYQTGAGIIPVTTGSGTPIISGKTGTIQVSTIEVTLAVSTNRSVKIPSPKR